MKMMSEQEEISYADNARLFKTIMHTETHAQASQHHNEVFIFYYPLNSNFSK